MRKSLIASLNFLTFTFGMLLVFSMTTSANGSVVIFSDDFSTDPAGNGWSIATTNSGTVTTTGSEALFDNVASMTTPPTTWSMTRSFSTVGFTSVSLDLSAFQSNAANGFEGVEPNRDFLQIQYDTGSGFMNLVQAQR